MAQAIMNAADGRNVGSGTADGGAWLTREAMAQRIGCSPRHVDRLARKGDLPPGRKFGRLIRWSRRAIEEWETGA